MNFAIQNSYLIPLLPLVAAVLVGLVGKRGLRGLSHVPIWLGVGASAVFSFMILSGMLGSHEHAFAPVEWFKWIDAGNGNGGAFSATAGAWIDPLTAVMLCVVCGIGFLITVFAAGYMKGEAGYWRFFAYLGLFIFAMTCLVMGDNLIVLYLGWEGVGLCSYLLIGYYYDKPAAREAAKKAFLVNRVGDLGFAVGIMLIWSCYGTVSYFGQGVGTGTGFLEMAANGAVHPGTESFVYWIPFALMLGAFGKSAQFPLHVWLPDAMEGPTPVSALIHAATMVTAGVYMIARLGAVFVGNDDAMFTIAVVGAFTAIFAAAIAMRQYDLKKVFAYSTISQLGFMFVAVGVLAPVAGVFHLVTHAFFKALLFLSSGVIMHAMLGHLDLRRMSGIKKQLPLTRIVFVIGCAALAGFPLLSGFWSKDEIIHATLSAGHGDHPYLSKLLYATLTFTALLTAYYTFRVYFRVFEGPNVVPTKPADVDAPDVEFAAAHAGTNDSAHAIAGESDDDKLPYDAHGKPLKHGHADHHAHDDHAHDGHHSHEPLIMLVPLLILAIGALFAGVINLPFNVGTGSHALGHFLGQSPSFELAYKVAARGVEPESIPTLQEHFGQPPTGEHASSVVPLLVGAIVACLGIAGAWANHLVDRARGERLAQSGRPLTTIFESKYWIDPLYNLFIVGPLYGVGVLLTWVDFAIDAVVGGVTVGSQLGGFVLRSTVQRGFLQGYAVTAVLGVALILAIVFLT